VTPETAVVVGSAISALGAVGVAALGMLNHRRTRDQIAHNTARTEEVLDQVGNDHTSNLRHDLDQALADLARLGGMVGKLTRKVTEALERVDAHDQASTNTVEGLVAVDRHLRRDLQELAEEVHRHHPDL
jgi:hypothetical protein